MTFGTATLTRSCDSTHVAVAHTVQSGTPVSYDAFMKAGFIAAASAAVAFMLAPALVPALGVDSPDTGPSIKDDAKSAGHAVAHGATTAGHTVADKSREAGHAVANGTRTARDTVRDDSKKAGHAIADGARNFGKSVRDGFNRLKATMTGKSPNEPAPKS